MTAPHPDQLREAVERCAEEPIHIPGSIQPHGFLLVLDDQHLRVRQASRNVADWLGLQADALLGQPLSELLANGALAKRLQALPHEDRNPFHMGDVSFIPAPQAGSFALLAHRHGQQLILEFEPVASDDEAYDLLYPLMRTFVARLHAAQSLTSICELAVQELSRITGFGRVKAYRFDPEGNGEVLAEQAAPGYASYLATVSPLRTFPLRLAGCTAKTSFA